MVGGGRGGGRLGLVVVAGALGGEGFRAVKCMELELPDTVDASLPQVSSCSSSLLLCSESLLCGSAKKVVPLSKSSQDSTDSTIIGSVVDAFDLGTAAGARLRLARRDQGPWSERLVVLLIGNSTAAARAQPQQTKTREAAPQCVLDVRVVHTPQRSSYSSGPVH